MEIPSPVPKESLTQKLHRLASVVGMVALPIIEGVWTMLRAKAIGFWHWSATWKWWDVLFIGAYTVSLGIHEFGIAVGSLILCAFSLISLLWHRKQRSLFIKCMGTVAICSGLTYLVYVTVQEKEDRPWSHLSRPIQLIFQQPATMQWSRRYVPTFENWAANQHSETTIPLPTRKVQIVPTPPGKDSEPSFSVAVELAMLTRGGNDYGTGFWLFYQQPIGCTLAPVQAALFIRVKNISSKPVNVITCMRLNL
jgi:hypothetical protein